MPFQPSQEGMLDWIDGGESKTYEFQIPDDTPPRLYWYHDHVHGKNAYSYLASLFGFILVEGTDQDLTNSPGILEAREIFLMLSEGLVNPEDGSVPPVFPIAMQFNWTSVTNGQDGRKTVYQVEQGEPILLRAASATVEPTIRLSFEGEVPNMMVVVANDGYPVQTMEETDTIVLSGGQRVEFMVRFDTPGNYTMIRQAWKIVPSLEACQEAFGIPVYPCVSYDIDQIVATFVVTETAVAVEKNLLPLIDTITLPTPAYPDSLIALAAQESVDRKTIAMQQSFASPLFQVPAVEGADLGGIPTGFGMNDR